jgi:outer membrane protein assembly factor BamB
VKTLEKAQEQIAKISGERDFGDAQSELAAILPQIADGLAADARKQIDPGRVAKARDTLKLIEKYVPKKLHNQAQLDNIVQSLAITDREIFRSDKLKATIANMEKAIKELRTADAYAACTVLVREYPDLASNAKLKQTLLDVSQAQQTLVKAVSDRKGPEANQPDSTTVTKAIALVQRTTKQNVPEAANQIALAAVDGCVFGVDAATGKVLWRRFVGFDANPQAPSFPPTPFSPEPGSDALVVATAQNDVLRLDGLSGQVRWRHRIGEPFDAHPVIADEKIFVATRGGKLVTLDAVSGESRGYVKLPQSLYVAPVFDKRRGAIYQVADHSNIFVITAEGGCKQVFYLGHEPGTVVTPPLVVDDYLLVAVNTAAHACEFRVLAIPPRKSDKPEPWFKQVQEVSLEGHIVVPPLVEGRRVMVTTTNGVVKIFELSGASEDKTPLRDIAETTIDTGDNVIRFPLLAGGQLWIADTKLTRYDVQAAAGHMVPKIVSKDEDAPYLQPPVALGQSILSVRRKPGMPGAIVSAVGMDDPPPLYWETRLASPLAGEPIVLDQGGKVLAVTGNGAIFTVEPGQAQRAAVREPDTAPDATMLKQPIRHLARLTSGLVAMSAGRGSDLVGVFDPKNISADKLYWPTMPDKLACAPIAMGQGLLVATRAGQICLLEPQQATPLAEPFQPRLEPGAEVEWTTPAVLGERQIVVSDGKSKVYYLRIQDEPKPHFEIITETVVAKPILSPLAALGEMAYGVDAGKLLAAFALPKLAPGKGLTLGGQCAWGPGCFGDRVVLSTDDGRLLCLDARGNLLWNEPLPYGPLAGAPLRLGETLLLASRRGTIWRVDVAKGKERGKLDVGLPLATGPVLFGQQLLVGGHDGTLYELRQP